MHFFKGDYSHVEKDIRAARCAITKLQTENLIQEIHQTNGWTMEGQDLKLLFIIRIPSSQFKQSSWTVQMLFHLVFGIILLYYIIVQHLLLPR